MKSGNPGFGLSLVGRIGAAEGAQADCPNGFALERLEDAGAIERSRILFTSWEEFDSRRQSAVDGSN